MDETPPLGPDDLRVLCYLATRPGWQTGEDLDAAPELEPGDLDRIRALADAGYAIRLLGKDLYRITAAGMAAIGP